MTRLLALLLVAVLAISWVMPIAAQDGEESWSVLAQGEDDAGATEQPLRSVSCPPPSVEGPASVENGQRAVFQIQGFAPGELITVLSQEPFNPEGVTSRIRADGECRAQYPSAVFVAGGGVTVRLTFSGNDAGQNPLAVTTSYTIPAQESLQPTRAPVQAVAPTSRPQASPFDFRVVDARVLVFGSGAFQLTGVVQNNGRIDAVPRLMIQTADGKPPVATEVCYSGICTNTSIDNIPPSGAAVFVYDGTLSCTSCRFSNNVLPGNDQVVVSVQGAFVR